MEQFLTWDILKDYVTFVGIVFSIVAFTKNAWLINKMPTRLWSFIVSFLLLILVNIHSRTFEWFDVQMLVLYMNLIRHLNLCSIMRD